MLSYMMKHGGTVFKFITEPLPNIQSWTKAGVKNPNALPEVVHTHPERMRTEKTTGWGWLAAGASELRGFVFLFPLGIISKFSWKSFETPLFYVENGNLAEETFLGFPRASVAQQSLRAPPWPPCKGQAHRARAQGLCGWQHWANAVWGVCSSFQRECPRLSAQIEWNPLCIFLSLRWMGAKGTGRPPAV